MNNTNPTITKPSRFWLLIPGFFLFLSAVWVSGLLDFDISLPYGYELSRTAPGVFCIFSQTGGGYVTNTVGHDGISANITGYDVIGEWVVGRREEEEYPGIPTTYFILNTRTGRTHQGLTREKWLGLLSEHNIRNVKLETPPRTLINAFLNR